MKLEMSAYDFAGGIQSPFPIFVKHKVDHRLTNHFFGRVAENAFACGTDKYKATVPTHHAHRIEQEVYEEIG
ncbi:MAG: hypothetical protein V7606_2585 [Burkholderiales bacterium]